MTDKVCFRTSLTVSLFLLATVPVSHAQYSGGSGTADDPYRIATAADLIALGETPDDYDKHFILTADIDLDPNLPGRKVFDRAVIAPDTNDVQSGFQGTSFTGGFDGDGHVISNLTIAGVCYLGLFGGLGYGATLQSLGLEAVKVTGDRYVGGLVGSNRGTIAICHVEANIRGQLFVGGLVGANADTGSIVEGYSACAISGDYWVGGLVGANLGSIIESYSTGSVSGESRVGGLAGDNGIYGSITESYSTAMVTGDGAVGGLVGLNWYQGSINESYSTGTVSGEGPVGGLVGNNEGSIATSYSSGAVSGERSVGGLVGANENTCNVEPSSRDCGVGAHYLLL